MKPKFLPAALAAAAAGALLAPAALATGNVTYTQGDLLLGFEEPGAANDYVVDLGSPTEFITLSQSGATTNLNTTLGLGNLAADLASSSGFGSSWYTLGPFGSNVQWGVFGAISAFGDSNLPSLKPDTLFETIAETTPGTRSTAPVEQLSGTQDDQSGLFAPFAQAGFNNSSATANSSVATFITASPPANSPYTSWSENDPSGDAFKLNYGIEQSQNPSNLYIGATNSRLDLYELIPTDEGGTGTAKDLGYFNLTSAGTLDFTGASVPEPSTYATIAFGATILLLIRRTRKPMGN